MSGSVGAATAAVIGNLVTWTAAHFLVGRHTAPLSSFYRTLVPIAVASAWWLAISFLDWGLFLRGGIALAGYAICAFMLGGGLAGDIRRLAFAKNALSRS
jgi:hypothetical protein